MGKSLAALAALVFVAGAPSNAATSEDARLAEIAYEARQAIAVVEWFYVRSRACPLPSRPAEVATLRDRLGDGYSAEPQGAFLEIRGISMAESWRYYASPSHPETCTLLRKLGGGGTLIWRYQRGIERWALDPGDGRAERPIKPAP
ncbi:MAG TPA: hypothetical protein VHU15_05215 [Stellaceae bacterium]|nr:hypothetical protein [Stellaceae bacterium]